MSRIVSIIILLVISSQAFAQDFKDLINKGDRLYAKSDFNNALNSYNKAEVLQLNNPAVQLNLIKAAEPTIRLSHSAR